MGLDLGDVNDYITWYLSFFRQYYLLIEAVEDFSELLITAIVDYPPDYVDNKVNTDARYTKENEPGFTIQRMGKL